MHQYDALVVGGGISGVSIAYELSKDRSVGLLDMESQLAYHTSSRSLATFLESYGGPVIRALTTGSRHAFENPIDVMPGDLLSPLGLLWVGPVGEGELILNLHEAVRGLVPDVRVVSPDEIAEINPAIAPGYAENGMYEPGATEIDVSALHQGYVRGLRANGGQVHVSARFAGAERRGSEWIVTDATGEQYSARTIVNAAGAWVDEVAKAAGAAPIGIRPLRRTAFLVTPPEHINARSLPLTGNIHVSWYFMPHGNVLACSPAEEALLEPCDAKPDQLEIARAIEELNAATTLGIRSIKTPWAGLRNFVPDRLPVVGFDPDVEGFFWYAAQGGYGMQTAPALSEVGASLIRGQGIKQDLVDRGLRVEDIAPDRPGMDEPAEH